MTDFDDVNVRVLHDSLNKIVINLLSNAIKYTPEHGQICVHVDSDEAQVRIAVKDSGIGIDVKDHEKIFERFNRTDQQQVHTIAGTGIGLALVKELVEANLGEISLQSLPGQGATFTVILPVSDSPSCNRPTTTDALALELENIRLGGDSIAVESNDRHSSSNERKTLLVIDDNADIRGLLYNHMQSQYECLLAVDGQQGLKIAREQMPDFILSDVMMPKIDGYELAQMLKEDPMTCHIPLVLLTAKGSAQSRIKGLKLLVDDYLPKPFNIEELQQRIENILINRENLRKQFALQLEQNAQQPDLQSLGMHDVDQNFVQKVNTQLALQYQDEKLGAKSLSQSLGVSERQLQRKIKALFDLTLPELIRNYRLSKAINLLMQGYRVSNIYLEVGFASHSYFSSCFKAKYGQTPSAYKQQNIH